MHVLSNNKIKFTPTFGGIINNNNKINVLGGFRKELNQQINWYISFNDDRNNNKKGLNAHFINLKISTLELKKG